MNLLSYLLISYRKQRNKNIILYKDRVGGSRLIRSRKLFYVVGGKKYCVCSGMTVYFQAYITCAIGVHYIGFLVIASAITSGITGYISGQLHQYVGRMSLILAGQFRVNEHRISRPVAKGGGGSGVSGTSRAIQGIVNTLFWLCLFYSYKCIKFG